MTAGDVPRNQEGRGAEGGAVRRMAWAGGALAALGSLAGCTDLLGDGGGPWSAVDGSRPDPAAGLSAEECEAGLVDLEADAERARTELAAVRPEVAELESRIERLETERDIFAPVDRSLVDRAERVGRDARPAVVYLEFEYGHATGWYLDDHHVVTNAHNVLDAGRVTAPTVWTVDGDSSGAEVVGLVDAMNPDVALLRTERAASASLTPGDSTGLGAGDPLVQVGHPGGNGNWVVSLGEFLEEEWWADAEIGSGRDLTTTVPGRTGVSGSPVLDLDGRVVGLTHSGTDATHRLGGERPIPSPEFVYDRMIGPRSRANHVPVETVLEAVEGWR